MKKSLMLRLAVAASIGCASFGLTGLAHAELIATPVSGDSRLVTFDYDEDNVYLVLARPRSVTRLTVGDDEVIVSKAEGDGAQFLFAVTNDQKHVLVRPKVEHVKTTLTIITNKRAYDIEIRSSAADGKFYQRVKWEYPAIMLQEFGRKKSAESLQLAQAAGDGAAASGALERASSDEAPSVAVENLNFQYRIEGDAPFRPSQVFDDGRITWIQMPTGMQELPALFRVVDGEPAIQSYLPKQGGYLAVQRVMDEFVLKIGKREVKIKRAGGASRRTQQAAPAVITGG